MIRIAVCSRQGKASILQIKSTNSLLALEYQVRRLLCDDHAELDLSYKLATSKPKDMDWALTEEGHWHDLIAAVRSNYKKVDTYQYHVKVSHFLTADKGNEKKAKGKKELVS
jgi:hypothetical protein